MTLKQQLLSSQSWQALSLHVSLINGQFFGIGLLLVVVDLVREYLSCYLERAIFSNYLTPAPDSGYASPVAGIPAPGLRARTVGGRTATSSIGGFFASAAWLCSLLGGPCGEPSGSPVPTAGLSTRMVPPIFAFESAMGGKYFPLKVGVQS